ncbi:hypothetical protein EZ449_15420 [Pedobacter frigidisoli]|uniref:Uncharacterized protein n=1 Tax=Pedobacter frigidisoli TaxID=2530455 RepID=A0A4R0NVZ5_9SPHI|nr:hypothetical protein [Pedobacter frigidisoli]TCD05852.1 hypothetical protein EZ449_15420 [Pedobacter frigidisoli]
MKAKTKTTILFIFLIAACQKEPLRENNPKQDQAIDTALTLSDAKDFIEQINPDSSSALAKIVIEWKLAKSEETHKGNKWLIYLSGQPTYQNYKQGYRQLVILRNQESQKIEAKILEIIPDAIYLQKKRRTKVSDFTGRVFEYNLNYKLTGGRLYSNGKPVGKIRQLSEQEQIDQANKMLKEINPLSGIQGKQMKMRSIETCEWVQDYYIDANGELTIHSTQLCSTTYFDDGGGGGYYDGVGSSSSGTTSGGGSGSGNLGTTSPPAPSNLPGENNSKVDPKKMMACFSQISTPNAAFVVRVYVVEPQPGTYFNVGQNSFGHVAISLSKTSGNTTITQTIGYYPTESGLDKLDSKSQILDNGFMAYNVSSTYYVSEDSFQKVITYLSNPPKQYHFTDLNCAAFVYGAGQAGGIPIPDPTTQIGLSGPGGAGFAKTPAGMAGALRDQRIANPNLDINDAGGVMPASKGECN